MRERFLDQDWVRNDSDPSIRLQLMRKTGKDQYAVVGMNSSKPDDPTNPYLHAKWDGAGDVKSFRSLYQVRISELQSPRARDLASQQLTCTRDGIQSSRHL